MLSRSAFKPRKRNAPRPAWRVAEAFRQWLRGRPCACGGSNPDCGGDIIAAHIDNAGKAEGVDYAKHGKGMGMKVSDRFNLPLSVNCHALQHRLGWPSFAAKYLPSGDAIKLCLRYWAAWPGNAAWEAKNDV